MYDANTVNYQAVDGSANLHEKGHVEILQNQTRNRGQINSLNENYLQHQQIARGPNNIDEVRNDPRKRDV